MDLADRELEARTIRKVAWRLLPLIVIIYLIAYIDRTNVSFAATGGMSQALGLSAKDFGFGAGIFFLGYFVFEVPSNLLLEKAGARRWIARIMISWGLVAGAMAFVTGPTSFVVMRFLLGVAEAGFFPGVILYFTYWFPKAYRSRVLASLYLAVPVSNAVTAALSGVLLRLDGALGLAGWQWLFLVEAAPAVLLAFVVLRWLTDSPAVADWLAPDEKAWLCGAIERERQDLLRQEQGHMSLRRAFSDLRVLSLALMYFTIVTATYGITYFLPQIVKGLGGSDLEVGLVSAAPYVVGTIGLLVWSWSSDRMRERKWHYIVACLLGAGGLAAAGLYGNTLMAVVAIAVATIGLYGCKPAFWTMPSEFLTGTAAAGGIAMINSIGNLGGFVGPFVVGWIKDATGGFGAALGFLTACAVLSALLALLTAPGRVRTAAKVAALPT
ncbi:major facilitator superfamily MFS_1 [Methylobacterium sp. 4-46]|uniref:MFS transporter n=1 Tax=unclassified Methylobacterium TaxID=2615210 RepID=UPI000152CBF6|nr:MULTISPECIES: MFS transporter [Methylobacterium]ACA17669.1 major facilitator superfamily MFS_1 [Methylobacterium sp. 4-46]WFT83339.1 MFS transporter [Methylobacterium nodulans]